MSTMPRPAPNGDVTASHRPSGETARRSEALAAPRVRRRPARSPVATSQILIFCMPTATTRRPSGVKATSLHVVVRSFGPEGQAAIERQHGAPGERLASQVVQPHLALLHRCPLRRTVDAGQRPGSGHPARQAIECTANRSASGSSGTEAVARDIPQRDGATGAGHRQGLAIRREGQRTARSCPIDPADPRARSPRPRTARTDPHRSCRAPCRRARTPGH